MPTSKSPKQIQESASWVETSLTCCLDLRGCINSEVLHAVVGNPGNVRDLHPQEECGSWSSGFLGFLLGKSVWRQTVPSLIETRGGSEKLWFPKIIQRKKFHHPLKEWCSNFLWHTPLLSLWTLWGLSRKPHMYTQINIACRHKNPWFTIRCKFLERILERSLLLLTQFFIGGFRLLLENVPCGLLDSKFEQGWNLQPGLILRKSCDLRVVLLEGAAPCSPPELGPSIFH